MSTTILNEREFELINIIGAELGSNQRDLSRHLNLSLGLTNMLIRRLIAKGYIRIRQLNKRKVEYMLTPKGFAEKMRKSVKYTLKTILSIGLIKDRLRVILFSLLEKGDRDFFIVGNSDLVHLIESVFREKKDSDYQIHYVASVPDEKVNGVILICEEDVPNKTCNQANCMNLIEEISKDSHLF